MKKILLTGCAGFIGHAIGKQLLASDKSIEILGIDNFDSYYSKTYKEFRLSELVKSPQFTFKQGNICSKDFVTQCINSLMPDVVIHTAAKVGVSSGESDPGAYIKTNVLGLSVLLEALKKFPPKQLISFSSSSVYGSLTRNSKESLSEDMSVSLGTALSIYGLTKATGESLLHFFANSSEIPTTIIRPFSVYGPYGRPDMLPAKAIKAAIQNKILPVYDSRGKIARDLTYIDDLSQFVSKIALHEPSEKLQTINIGSGQAHTLLEIISELSSALDSKGLQLLTKLVDERAFESEFNLANIAKATALGYRPTVSLEKGIKKTVDFFTQHPKFL